MNMGIVRHRSSDRLGLLIQEIVSTNEANGEIGDVHGQSLVPSMLNGNTSASNLMASPMPPPPPTPLVVISNKKTKTAAPNYSYRLLALLGVLAMLHIKQSSTRSLSTTYRMLTTADTSIPETLTSSSSSSKSEEDKDEGSSIFVDIISVGSITKSNFQTAQEETFRTHPTVRNFYRITELNDTDATCHTDLTYPKLQQVIRYCKSPRNRRQTSHTSSLLRKLVYHPKNHTGWMCAQKRPIDGLRIALQQYIHKAVPIPNYLIIIDDDTYLNMHSLMGILHQNHSETTTTSTVTRSPQLVTGCRYNYPPEEHFVFPFGGFGTIMSRTVIQNLIQPIRCSSDGNAATQSIDNGFGFVQSACWRLQQNLMGELQYFRDGMTIGDLMNEYIKQLSFTQVDSWENGQGFCFHSDHALGYFFGYYHVSVPEEQFILALSNSSMYDTMRYEHGYTNLAGPPDGCKHFKNRCTMESSICHYISPYKMHSLFRSGNSDQLQEPQ